MPTQGDLMLQSSVSEPGLGSFGHAELLATVIQVTRKTVLGAALIVGGDVKDVPNRSQLAVEAIEPEWEKLTLIGRPMELSDIRMLNLPTFGLKVVQLCMSPRVSLGYSGSLMRVCFS